MLVLIACTLALLLASLGFAIYERATHRAGLVAELSSMAEILGANAAASITFNDRKTADDVLGALRTEPHILAACLFDVHGSVFARYQRKDLTYVLQIPGWVGEDTATFRSDSLVLYRGVYWNGERAGYIAIVSDLRGFQTKLREYLKIVGLVLFLCMQLMFLVVRPLLNFAIQPILELCDIAGRVSEKENYSLRANTKARDEVGRLVGAFNEMLNRIQDRDTELQTINEELEKRVNERTCELQKEVAERTEAEHVIRERTNFLNSLIENAPMGIVAIATDDSIQMSNPAFEKVFGYKQEQVVGRLLPELLSNKELDLEIAGTIRSLREGKATNLVTQRKKSDGTMVDVEAYSVPLCVEGKYNGGLLLYQDITERKQYEAALVQAKEAAEVANRAKSEFLANMSHEIRTPLNGVIGMTDLALDTELTADQREYLETVKLSGDSLLLVINDILDFSKIEAGRIDVETIDFDLRECLETTLKTLALRAQEKGLELLFEMSPEAPNELRGDPTRLRQIVTNLLGNAIKFTAKGEVVLRVFPAGRDEKLHALHFVVSDTGIGIPEDKRKLIFDPFSQADASTTRKYGGTGLGLTISARLVQIMGGRIWVNSKEGEGSDFHFTLKFAEAERKIRHESGASLEVLRGVRVLIVDDNQTNQRILVGMVKYWGMTAEVANGGEEALALLTAAHSAGKPFALVLTDAHMPKMDGFTLIEKIRAQPELAVAEIMMLTSAGHRGDADRCKEFRVGGYLLKPVRRCELGDAITRVLTARDQGKTPKLVTRYHLTPGRASRESLEVLVAEDNAVNQRLISRLLEKRGHGVTLVENGRQALEKMQVKSYDLVFMDIQMPEMDGLEATVAVRHLEQERGGHQPIVALTAHAMKGDEQRCLSAGMDDYLCKPIQVSELDTILEKYGARHREPKTLISA